MEHLYLQLSFQGGILSFWQPARGARTANGCVQSELGWRWELGAVLQQPRLFLVLPQAGWARVSRAQSLCCHKSPALHSARDLLWVFTAGGAQSMLCRFSSNRQVSPEELRPAGLPGKQQNLPLTLGFQQERGNAGVVIGRRRTTAGWELYVIVSFNFTITSYVREFKYEQWCCSVLSRACRAPAQYLNEILWKMTKQD